MECDIEQIMLSKPTSLEIERARGEISKSDGNGR